jgi:intein-encoded DNA endonuclease-like protein
MENEEMPLLPNYKDIVELIRKGSTIEAQKKILELNEAVLKLQEENLALRQRVKALEEAKDSSYQPLEPIICNGPQ